MNVDDIFKAPPPKRKGETDLFSKLPAPKQLKSSIHQPPKNSFAFEEKNLYGPLTTSPLSYSQSEKIHPEYGASEIHDDGDEESRFYEDGLSERERTILDFVDEAEQVQVATLDGPALKRMVHRFERVYVRNQEAREKYMDEPTRFMDFELDLDSEIRSFSILATSPHLYQAAQELKLPSLFLQVLAHDNSDIRIAAVEVLIELTDDDVVPPDEEGQALLEDLRSFILSLIDEDLLQLLETAYHAEEEEENQWKYYTLLDNLLTAGLQLSETLVKKTTFLTVFLNDLKDSTYSANLGYKVELLAMILQESAFARDTWIQKGGMDPVLRALSKYRKRDPPDSDELEFMANLFDMVCACLTEAPGMHAFRKEEGIELMLLMAKASCRSRIQGIRVLNYATMPHTKEGRDNAVTVARLKGQQHVFQLFLRQDQKRLQKAYKSEYHVQDDEENIICLLTNLVRALQVEHSPLLEALLEPFREQQHEKLIHLTTLFSMYQSRMAAMDVTDKDDEQVFLDKLEKGFFSLAHLAMLIGLLFQADAECKEYLTLFLHKIGITKDTLVNVLREYTHHASKDQEEFLNTLIESLDF